MQVLGAGIGVLLGALIFVGIPSLFAKRWDQKQVQRILDQVYDDIYKG